ncbi:MAG: hypothetical protein AAFQ80_13320 [Cyanobacteria bacterium J06621_8]
MNSDQSLNKILSRNLIIIVCCFLIALGGFGYILTTLPGGATQSPVCIEGGWKLGLIITHILTFALIPLAMRVFFHSLDILLPDSESKDQAIFGSQLGLSFRGYRLLETWKIILFPLFSVGVNLTFIFLLDQYGTEPVTNALFHILHDFGGTEAGVLIFTWLFYQKALSKDNSASELSSKTK